MKNKDTYVYTSKTAGDVVRMIARDFMLRTGEIAATGYRIPSKVEDGVELFDIIQHALDDTLMHTGNEFILYDDFGALTLKPQSAMTVPILIDKDTARSLSYSSDIDTETYNRVRLVRDDDKKKTREAFIAQDSANINRWGVLQHYEKIQAGEDGQRKADGLLELYNRPSRSISVSGVYGDPRVRGGSLVAVQMSVLGKRISHFMVVDKAQHSFKQGDHTMDLELIGGAL